MYYNGYVINVILLENAFGIPGSVHLNKDDSYSIFIDAKLNYEMQQKVFQHELRHITNKDFEKFDVNEIEINNHKLDKRKDLRSVS